MLEMFQPAVLRMLAGMAPDRTWSLTRTCWYGDFRQEGEQYYDDWNVSVHPGYNGKDCQVFYADTIDEVLDLARAAHLEYINQEVADPVEPVSE
jgi:hypothetical protein